MRSNPVFFIIRARLIFSFSSRGVVGDSISTEGVSGSLKAGL